MKKFEKKFFNFLLPRYSLGHPNMHIGSFFQKSLHILECLLFGAGEIWIVMPLFLHFNPTDPNPHFLVKKSKNQFWKTNQADTVYLIHCKYSVYQYFPFHKKLNIKCYLGVGNILHNTYVWVVASYSHSSFRAAAAAENRFIIVVAGSHDFFNSNSSILQALYIIIPSRQVLWHCFDNIGKTWTYTPTNVP